MRPATIADILTGERPDSVARAIEVAIGLAAHRNCVEERRPAQSH